MTYCCIGCGKTWLKGEPTDFVSHGICGDCYTGLVRSKQREKGFHDCYKRAVECCSRSECSHIDVCCRGLC